MSASPNAKPWYVKEKKKKRNFFLMNDKHNTFLNNVLKFIYFSYCVLKLFRYSFIGLCVSLFASLFFLNEFSEASGFKTLILFFGVLLIIAFVIYLLVAQIGSVCANFAENPKNLNKYALGYAYLTSQIKKSKPRTHKVAAELILKQFVQQVRLYSLEKNYYLQKNLVSEGTTNQTKTLLQRRWQDVEDTLDEFDIYQSPSSEQRIESLISILTPQMQDVSEIFQNSAESFESSWRLKGINIEHAIVVPLKAHINAKILKRFLAGAWRASVYFVPKGGTVTFAAKYENNQIIARWACLGATFSPHFYETIQDTSLSINTRIEIGMTYVSNQPHNSNILFGLISLIILNDITIAAKTNFKMKQGNDGMILTLIL